MSQTDQVVLCERRGPVSIMSLDRPAQYNAWGSDMATQLRGFLQEADEDSDVEVCVITGAGNKAFCSGANLQNESTHRTTSVDDYLMRMRPAASPIFFEDLLRFRKPLICAVNGYAIGAGFLLTLCTDIILASRNAVFQLPQARLGILPAYAGTARLAQWIGRGRAMQLALTGRRLGAEEAQQVGLVSEVVATPGEVLGEAIKLAEQLAEMPVAALALTKESLNRTMEAELAHTGMSDLYRFLALSMTSDAASRHERWREERSDRRPGVKPD